MKIKELKFERQLTVSRQREKLNSKICCDGEYDMEDEGSILRGPEQNMVCVVGFGRSLKGNANVDQYVHPNDLAW